MHGTDLATLNTLFHIHYIETEDSFQKRTIDMEQIGILRYRNQQLAYTMNATETNELSLESCSSGERMKTFVEKTVKIRIQL